MGDAHKMYAAKWGEEFKFMEEFNFLKDFPRYMFDLSQALKNVGKDGTNARKAPGGPRSRKVPRMRQADEDEDDPRDRPPGQSQSRKLRREDEEREVVKARNLAAIVFEQETYTKRAALLRQTIMSDDAKAAAECHTTDVNREVEDNVVVRMIIDGLDDKEQKYWKRAKKEAMRRSEERYEKRVADTDVKTTHFDARN